MIVGPDGILNSEIIEGAEKNSYFNYGGRQWWVVLIWGSRGVRVIFGAGEGRIKLSRECLSDVAHFQRMLLFK